MSASAAAGYPASGETFDQMIVAADKIMYERKVSRKRLAQMAKSDPLNRERAVEIPHDLTDDSLIVELDESHVLASSAVN